MAKFFFFTDPEQIQNQTDESLAFGPINENQFRISSIHDVTPDAPVYSAINGILLIQEAEGGNSLNAILKPITQPKFADIGYIDFFIYRGLKKESLIDLGTEENGSYKILPPNVSNLNEISAFLDLELRSSLYKTNLLNRREDDPQANTNTPPRSENIGFNYRNLADPNDQFYAPDEELIERLMYAEKENIQLPFVYAGVKIGEFIGPQCSFEIIEERVGYETDFKLSRKTDNQIVLDPLPDNPTPVQYFEFKQKKEEILHYIDPAAFYGALYASKDGFAISSENINNNTSELEILQKFYNKDVLYIDIRNEYNYSFSFFKEYNSFVLLKNVAFPENHEVTGSEELSYNNNPGDWPLLRLKGRDALMFEDKAYVSLAVPNLNKYSDINQGVYIHNKCTFIDENSLVDQNGNSIIWINNKVRKGRSQESNPENGTYSRWLSFTSWKLESGKLGANIVKLKIMTDAEMPRVINNGIIVKGQGILNMLFPFHAMKMPFKLKENRVYTKTYRRQTKYLRNDRANSRSVYLPDIGIAIDVKTVLPDGNPSENSIVTLYAYKREGIDNNEQNDISFFSEDRISNPEILTDAIINEASFLYSLVKTNPKLELAKLKYPGTEQYVFDYIEYPGVKSLEYGLNQKYMFAVTMTVAEYNALSTHVNDEGLMEDMPVFLWLREIETVVESKFEFAKYRVGFSGFKVTDGNIGFISKDVGITPEEEIIVSGVIAKEIY